MKSAREVAHAIVCERQDSEWCHWTTDRTVHAHYCDRLTAAIEARDAEHAAELDRHVESGQDALRVRTAASLALDGMPARWRRICWHCDKGWGHNVGGRKLGHAPSKNGDEKHTPAATRDKPKPRRRPR